MAEGDLFFEMLCFGCTADPMFDKAEVCDSILQHGGCILDNFDPVAVSFSQLFCYIYQLLFLLLLG